MPLEVFVDHVGSMTANVADNAMLLRFRAVKGPEIHELEEERILWGPKGGCRLPLSSLPKVLNLETHYVRLHPDVGEEFGGKLERLLIKKERFL